MDYFLLESKVSNPIKLLGLDETMYRNNLTDAKFGALPTAIVAYIEYFQEREVPDLLARPLFLISDVLKEVMEIYEKHIQWKAIQVMPQKEEMITSVAPLYWAGNYPTQNCLHQDAMFFPDGRLEQLIVDQKKIRSQDIFKIGGIMENRIVISLKLAESILRRNLYGIGLTELIIR